MSPALNPADARGRRVPTWGLAAAIAVAAALRFATLSTQSFDGDELYTAWLVRQPFGEMLGLIPDSESTPYLYYLLAWVWTHALGDSEAALRSLSALFGVLTVPAAALLARRLFSTNAALAAAALVAVSPLLVWFSQQARAYALLVLLVTLAAAAFADALQRGEGRAVRWWALWSALALATHYFAAFLIVPQALWLLARARGGSVHDGGLRWVALPALVGAALVPLAWAQRNNPGGIEDAGLGSRIAQIPKAFLVGFEAPAEVVLTVAAAALALVVAVGLARLSGGERWSGALAGLMAAAFLVPPIVLALAGVDLVGVRNVLPALVPALVLLAAGAVRSRVGALAAAGLVAVSLVAVIGVAAEPELQRADWRAATRAIGPAEEPRALVLRPGVDPGPLSVYVKGAAPLPESGARVAQIDLVALATESTFSAGHPRPPRPASVTTPPGFRETWRRETPTYTVIRLTAERPRRIGALDLLAPKLGSGGIPALYVQAPPPGH